ncbi:isopenicillin N synthase family dioxygenase [Streptomyces sp. NRRL B-1347]|uniref:isopenicillin N synthase family dioxygenase n=1 Tax=Streptomyces sp. NRRL B-1347 TaxID=1476877 RepID=UPI0004C87FFE|nr:2-oxoglutarate and iron-dependent oxygenase domain-containing protein [Streptomyces sp. NRRL B-1347]
MSSDQLTVTVTDGFVPVIDLSSRDSAHGRAAIAEAIGGALRSSGFFIIVGHGVPQQLIDRMFTVTNSFFKLPEDEKDLVASRPGVSGYRRAGGTLARSLDQKTPPDLCETFAAHVTGELADEERDKLGGQWASWTHKNIWPDNPADFRDTWQKYMAAMEDLAADLMRLFARALDLDLDEEFFADKFDHHGSSIAVNYYPPQLEPPLPGQIGDLMALWTGGRWVSTMHRVANPADGDTSSRLTMPFFYLPNHDASIEPMRPFTDSPAVERFDTVTVSEWVSRKVQKIFS